MVTLAIRSSRTVARTQALAPTARCLGRMLGMLVLLFALQASVGGLIAIARAAPAAAAGATLDDWPSFQHDALRTSASADTTLAANNGAQLTRLWSYKTGGIIVPGAAVVNGVVYAGSWDGYEYALNATTGALIWKTFIGQTVTGSSCGGATAGVSSSATVQNGVVYVGGGDAYWYALDAGTGAILWKVYTGDNSATGGHYNWSSPLIYNGYAYIGVASYGDCPLVQGQLLQVSLTTQQVVNTLNTVPSGAAGGGIWGSPALDPTTNTVYFTTGNANSAYPLGQAMVAVDAGTLAVKGSWQIPNFQAVPDSDWGTTPILFDDAGGRHLAAALNKDGYLYAFDRSNIANGPVWERRVAVGGSCPQCGDGSVANMAFGSGMLYVAAGNTVIGGIPYPSSVRALDPATGNIIWEHGDRAVILPGLAFDNGLIVAATGSVVEVLDAPTGNRLYSYQTGSTVYGPPSVAHGVVYIGSNDDNVYAFGLPATTPSLPPADPQCPSGWTCQDIGAPTPAGTEAASGTTWTINSGGSGVAGASDSFRLISQAVTGDMQISAQITALQNTASSAQVGLMVRQTNDPSSPYFAVFATPAGGLRLQYRSAWGGSTTTPKTMTGLGLPLYVEIQRTGDILQAATSTDGVNYTLVPGSSVVVVMPMSASVGVATSSGANGTAGSATVSGVTIGSVSSSPAPYPSPSPCPAGWNCQDVGNPAQVGDQSLANGAWTISGGGSGISGFLDQFHFVWLSTSGDSTFTAHVATQTNTSSAARAGVMLRQDTTSYSAYYGAFVTPGKGILIQYRDVVGPRTRTLTTLTGTAPQWLRVVRSGNSFTTYTSPDGVTWTSVANSTITLNLNSTLLAGLGASSNNTGQLSTVTFDTVSLTSSALPPGACPSAWTCGDVGSPYLSGTQTVANGQWTIQAGGDDIWANYDQFHFAYQSLPSDALITARVTSQSNTDPWAKAGVMLRATTDPAAAYYAVYITPGNGLAVQLRSSNGGNAVQTVNAAGTTLPVYLGVARSGTTFTAYTSSDGTTWTPIAGSTIALTNLSGAFLGGLAVTSHSGATLGTAVFDTVTVANSAPTPPGVCPSGWTCQDVGGPYLSGTQQVSAGVWNVQAGGDDIWSNSDQFHFAYQSLATDGNVSAHVTAQTNTSAWAKAGVMLRASADPAAAYYAAFVTPANGIVVQYRSASGGYATQAVAITGSVPAYLMVARSGTSLTAYNSADGSTWSLVPGSTVTLANLGGTLLAGLAVTSHNSGTLSSVTYDNVSVSTTVPAHPACSSGWTCSDVGSPYLSGSATASNGVWSVQGAGDDIWGNSDQFQFAYQSLAADGSVAARVASQANSSPWAKAGVMLRATTDAASAYYAVLVTPGNGVVVQVRDTAGGYAYDVAQITGTVPVYLKVARAGTTFTAYTSPDGTTWTPVAGSTVTLANLTGSLLAGLAVTSHNGGALCAVTFDNVAVTPA